MLTDAQIRNCDPTSRSSEKRPISITARKGALSDAVEAGMREFAASWRTSAAPWDDWMETYEALRADFARFINAQPDEVAIVTSASAGINPIANALQLRRPQQGRDERVRVSHHGAHLAGAAAARRARSSFWTASTTRFRRNATNSAIDERTRIVPLTHVSFVNGYRGPM